MLFTGKQSTETSHIIKNGVLAIYLLILAYQFGLLFLLLGPMAAITNYVMAL